MRKFQIPNSKFQIGRIAFSVCLGIGAIVLLLGVLHGDVTRAAPQALPLDVVINEVAWAGHAGLTSDEWIELYNNTSSDVNLTGWTLRATTGTLNIALSGIIQAKSYYLVERTDDNTVSDIPADWFGSFGTGLSNGGDVLTLRDGSSIVIDTANGNGGSWPGGTTSPGYYSMERIDSAAADTDGNWASNNGVIRNGLDANGQPVNGTPKARNSIVPIPSADLSIVKTGPSSAQPGERITYTIHYSNTGDLAAQGVRLTDTLPVSVSFIAAIPAPSQPTPDILVWSVSDVPNDSQPITVTVVVTVAPDASDWLTNWVTITTVTTETVTGNNASSFSTFIGSEPPPLPHVLISAVHYYGYDGYDDEAIQLTNVGTQAVSLLGWRLAKAESLGVVLPDFSLAPGQRAWATRDAASFYDFFGHWPDFALVPTNTVLALTGSWLNLPNDSGADVRLMDNHDVLQDRMLYGTATTIPGNGWESTAVQPYTPSNAFARSGQILYRKLDEATGLPADTNTAADWAQDAADPLTGRRVRYPGWDVEQFYRTAQVTQSAWLTVGVAPDNAFDVVAQVIASAQHTLTVEVYSFENTALANLLAGRAQAGVLVTLLLEGEPAGGVTAQEKWACQQVENAGGACWFLFNDASLAPKVYDRYSNQHAKIIVADDRVAAIGSENFSLDGLPDDDKTDGTAGHRGVVLVTDAPGVVARVRQIWAADFDPAHHRDLVRWSSSSPTYGPPPIGYVPITVTGGTTSTVFFPQPLVLSGTFPFEVIQSPENSLRQSDSLLGLIGRAGAGDEIVVEQLQEPPHWGPSSGAPSSDPNVYLEALIAAAARGAHVRLLLDGYFSGDDNSATVAYVESLRASSDTLRANLHARTGNPTALGIHNKMVLALVSGRGYVHVGSLNHGELAAKGNRELALQVQSDQAYAYLQHMFNYDWYRLYLPMVLNNYTPPAPPVEYVVVSEVLYDPFGDDIGTEWVELYNPTDRAIDLSGWSLGDAVVDGEYGSGRYLFPTSTVLLPGEVIIIAQQAADVLPLVPDFEFLIDPNRDLVTVTNMIPVSVTWDGFGLALGNAGDEVILRDSVGALIDALVWGTGNYTDTGVLPHPGVNAASHSLERRPAMYDTDDCGQDFFDRYPPDPGQISNALVINSFKRSWLKTRPR